MTVRDKFMATRSELGDSLLERYDEIDLILIALIAKEHALLVGPPGCAKTMLLDAIMKWINGSKFSILLNKFTEPSELFGPVSIPGLKEDRFVRITTGKLPEADLAYLDEVFKASSAILNTMLRILNERTFDRGDGHAHRVPLLLCVGASNEWPSPDAAVGISSGKELAALFDRFVLRKSVRPIMSQTNREKLMWGGEIIPHLSTTITREEIESANHEAIKMPWSEEAKEAMREILMELRKLGIQPGDRRLVKSAKVSQAHAWLNGNDEVKREDLESLAHVLWDDPAEQPVKCAQVVARIANPTGMKVNSLLIEAEEILGTDVKKLDEAAKSAAKLSEIAKKLKALPEHPRRTKALEYVEDKTKELKLKAIGSI